MRKNQAKDSVFLLELSTFGETSQFGILPTPMKVVRLLQAVNIETRPGNGEKISC